ncbi:MAG TPA: hypothetical protein VIV54_18805, partial [Burkholderiales bacterium]
MKRDERPLSAVSPWVWAALVVFLAAQIAWRLAMPPPRPMASDLPPAPAVKVLRLASLGEPEASARL